ncbi:MAG: nucleotidyltransferase family protein [Candidatus Thorarchaeota archaeon]
MRCIIPAAGRGTRLRPHTNTKPKVLLSLGNKPLISHIMDSIIEADITDIIIVVGYEKEKLINFIKSNYEKTCNLTFLEQKDRRGLGHAIYTAGEYLDGEPVLIALGDSLYENSFSLMLDEYKKFSNWAGAITVKSVSNPQAYGIVNTHEKSNEVKELVEKPQNPTSTLAITGVYIIRDSLELKYALEELVNLNQIGIGGEIQLTDALQSMVQKGLILGVINSGRWFDCGKKDALLAAHKYVLDKNRQSSVESELKNTILIPPIAIQTNCDISDSIIGPYVSIDKGTTIKKSILSSSIIGSGSHINNTSIHDSLIGDEVNLFGKGHTCNIGDHSKVQL